MLNELLSASEALEKLSDKVEKSWGDDRTLREAFGWNCPALTRHDLASIASNLAKRIRSSDIQELDKSILTFISDIPRRLTMLEGETVPNLYNGNASQAASAYIETIEQIENSLNPHLDWQAIADNRLIPTKLLRRLRSIQSSLDEIIPEKEDLQRQIQSINEATEAAESLPSDLETLRRARNEVEKISTSSASTLGKIEENHKNSNLAIDNIKAKEIEAEKLIQQCQEAYRITTTTGLAASFDERAKSLNRSMWTWVVGLLSALGIGSYIGSNRIELLSASLKDGTSSGIILIHVLLSALSVGAPIWLAWLATKQIGQRFRLAEDYGFKASVAKAYEGYRREAARIDPSFEARLFSSALTRLDEAPLRLVESESHGSPWHELINSKPFQQAIEKIPGFRDKFLQITISDKQEKLTAPDKSNQGDEE